MLTSESVGTTRVILSPEAANNAPYSGAVRSSPPGTVKHHHVNDLSKVRSVAVRQHELNYQQFCSRLHRITAIAENRRTLLFVPIMNDVRQDVCVAAGGNMLEEVAVLD